jgi:propane monooxygenase large subunit
MSTATTLAKITSQPGISIAEAARRVSDLGWAPAYVQQKIKYPTDYKITRAPKDPMKQVLRSYFPMQEEKDNRVYGALDAALRGDMFRNVQPRWIEWMKLFLAIIPFPEISAARSMAIEARIAPGDELRTGFTMQMIDEMRHSTIQMNLKKWYMENYIDPSGFDITEAAFVNDGVVLPKRVPDISLQEVVVLGIVDDGHQHRVAVTVMARLVRLHTQEYRG